jgi:Fe-S oxidoreductase
MSEIDRCVRCGSCLQYCPLFNVTGEEQFSPRGKLYLLQVMDLIENDEELGRDFRKLLFQCTMCGRCGDVCSADVDLLKIWHDQRAKAVGAAPLEFQYLDSLKDSLANVYNIYGLDPDDRAIYWLDEVEDDIPNIHDRVYTEGKTAEIMIFLGCLMSFRSSQLDVVKGLLKALESVDADYLVMGAEEFCCGHPLHLTGDETGADTLRAHNRSVVEDAGAKRVITGCPGCLIQLRKYHKFENTEALHHTEFFDHLSDELPKTKRTETFAYHDPCELGRILEVKEEPRSVLNKLGVKFKEMDLSCCGGGGLLRMTDPNLSDKIIQLKRATEELQDTKVVTACPSCREVFLSKEIETLDIVELLAEALEEGNE